MNFNDTTRHALDRFASLGTLYDVSCDQIISGSIFSQMPAQDSEAITCYDTPNINYTLDDDNTYTSTLKNLDAENELKVNILAGIVNAKGTGKFLRQINDNGNVVRLTMIYRVETYLQTLNLSNKNLKSCIIDTWLKDSSATHVVTKIKWGVCMLVSFSVHVENNTKRREIRGELSAAIEKLGPLASAGGEMGAGRKSEAESKLNNTHIELFGDIVTNQLPQTVEEVRAFIKSIPENIKNINGGKGKQLEFTLTPINEVARQLGISDETIPVNRFIRSLSSSIVRSIENASNELLYETQKLNQLDDNIRKYRNHLQAEAYDDVMDQRERLHDMVDGFREELASLLNTYRSSKADDVEAKSNILKRLKEQRSYGHSMLSNRKIQPLKEKIDIIQRLQEIGVKCLERDELLSSFLLPAKEIFVLVINGAVLDSSNTVFQKTFHDFCNLVQNNQDKATFFMQDLALMMNDDRPTINATIARIDHYHDGKLVQSNEGEFIMILQVKKYEYSTS